MTSPQVERASKSTRTEAEVRATKNLPPALHQAAHDIAAERIRNGWSFRNNDIEIDEDAATSEGEDGCWVRAWVHIERDAYSDKPES